MELLLDAVTFFISLSPIGRAVKHSSRKFHQLMQGQRQKTDFLEEGHTQIMHSYYSGNEAILGTKSPNTWAIAKLFISAFWKINIFESFFIFYLM